MNKPAVYKLCIVVSVSIISVMTLLCFINNHDFNTAEEGLRYYDSGKLNLIVDDVRIQLLSDTLIRIEQKGNQGFEDRSTFTIADRNWPGVNCEVSEQSDQTKILTKQYRVVVDNPGQTFQNLRIESINGEILFNLNKKNPKIDFLPNPKKNLKVWTMADRPRIIPPPWGASPIPNSKNLENHPFSGWDIKNDAFDVYVFLPGNGGYEQFRNDFIKLTGPIPLPPLYVFGLWNSRYHPYTEDSALETVRTYRAKSIPMDVFVLDTDWRVGGAIGYEINKTHFPDMARFARKAHGENVRLVINDHPEAVGESALNPEEMSYRYEQLTKILGMGIDAWWYDRNWHAHLKTPAPGISKEIWGMRVYHDITQRFRPERRSLILSNVDGIDHGKSLHPSHPAAHRYPIWWTGDTKPEWSYLQRGIANAVNSGIYRMMPYVSEDIGGHYGIPSEEFYVRSIQYGVFSPILRLHSSGKTRYPWGYGKEAEKIATEYIRLRYRLLPTIYAAARRAYVDGTPILRRCDLHWPEYKEAKNDQQYLFCDDLLVAPVNDGKGLHGIPDKLLNTNDGQPGLLGKYFDNMELKGEPVLVRIDRNIDFDWGEGKGSHPAEGLPKDYFSIRWEGKLGPIPQSGEYEFGVTADDGLRLWVDDQLVIDFWKDQGAALHTGRIQLEKEHVYDLRLEYYDRAFKSSCKMAWWNLDDHSTQKRTLWIPPGIWQNLWTGKKEIGPKTITVSSPLWHVPIYARQGGLFLSLPQIQHTRQNSWNVVVVDAFLPLENGKTTRTLYEDDGISIGYLRGEFCSTPLKFLKKESQIFLRIGGIEGHFPGCVDERTWIVRFHFDREDQITKITVDDNELVIHQDATEREGLIARLITSSNNEKQMVFLGKGEEPPPSYHSSHPFLEWWLIWKEVHYFN